MRCMQVTFLYKLAEGACPKSYGTSVARLAGLPASLVARAAQLAQQLEHNRHTGELPQRSHASKRTLRAARCV